MMLITCPGLKCKRIVTGRIVHQLVQAPAVLAAYRKVVINSFVQVSRRTFRLLVYF